MEPEPPGCLFIGRAPHSCFPVVLRVCKIDICFSASTVVLARRQPVHARIRMPSPPFLIWSRPATFARVYKNELNKISWGGADWTIPSGTGFSGNRIELIASQSQPRRVVAAARYQKWQISLKLSFFFFF